MKRVSLLLASILVVAAVAVGLALYVGADAPPLSQVSDRNSLHPRPKPVVDASVTNSVLDDTPPMSEYAGRSPEELLDLILRERTSETYRRQTVLPHLARLEQEFYGFDAQAFDLLVQAFDSLCDASPNDSDSDERARAVSYLITQFPGQAQKRSQLFLNLLQIQTEAQDEAAHEVLMSQVLSDPIYRELAIWATTRVRCRTRLAIMLLELQAIPTDSAVAKEGGELLESQLSERRIFAAYLAPDADRSTAVIAGIWVSCLYYYIERSEADRRGLILKWGEKFANVVLSAASPPVSLQRQLLRLYESPNMQFSWLLRELSRVKSSHVRSDLISERIATIGFVSDDLRLMWLAIAEQTTASRAAEDFSRAVMTSYARPGRTASKMANQDELMSYMSEILVRLSASEVASAEAALWCRVSFGLAHLLTMRGDKVESRPPAEIADTIAAMTGEAVLQQLARDYFPETGAAPKWYSSIWAGLLLPVSPYILRDPSRLAGYLDYLRMPRDGTVLSVHPGTLRVCLHTAQAFQSMEAEGGEILLESALSYAEHFLKAPDDSSLYADEDLQLFVRTVNELILAATSERSDDSRRSENRARLRALVLNYVSERDARGGVRNQKWDKLVKELN